MCLANSDCASDRRLYYANIQLFWRPGPSGGGSCGKYVFPPDEIKEIESIADEKERTTKSNEKLSTSLE